MDIAGKKITLHDMCLRDGMHTKRHQISLDEMIRVSTHWTMPECHLLKLAMVMVWVVLLLTMVFRRILTGNTWKL